MSSVTKLGAGNPKVTDETTRDTERQLHQKLTAYDRYIKYGKFPRKKNARKRVGRRIEKNIRGLTQKDREAWGRTH